MLVNIIRPVPDEAVDFVAKHEGCRLTAYPDPATGREPWTIGYGSTSGVVPGMTISEPDARARLLADLQTAARRLEATVGEDCVQALTENQYSSLLSFVFNLGIKPNEKIWGLLRAKNFDAVPPKMLEYVYGGGRKMAGLVRRRADEVQLWSTGEPGATEEAPPSSVSREMDTPPVAAVVKPLPKSKSWWGAWTSAGLASASAIAPHIKDAADGAAKAVEPYVGQSTILQGISSHLALVAAAAALAVPALLWLKNHEAKSS